MRDGSGNALPEGFHSCLETLPDMKDGDLVLLRTDGNELTITEEAAIRLSSVVACRMFQRQDSGHDRVTQGGITESVSSCSVAQRFQHVWMRDLPLCALIHDALPFGTWLTSLSFFYQRLYLPLQAGVW